MTRSARPPRDPARPPRRALRRVAGALALSLALGAGGALAQPGVSDDEIRIGNWGPQSGPAAAWGTVTAAIDAYFRYLNDQGGVHGRDLVLVSRDDGYDPARTVQAARELTTREDVFALVAGVGTANGLAAMPIVQREGIPWVSPATGAVEFAEQSNGLVFATFTNYQDEASLMTRHAVEELGAANVAVFHQNDGYGESGLMGVEREIEAQKAAGADVTLGDTVSYERGETNMAVQALRLKGSGADAVVMYADPTAANSLINEFQRIDYHPQILASTTLLDPTLIANPGMQGALFATFLKLPSVIVGEGNGAPEADAVFSEIVVPYAPQAARDPFRALAGIAFAQPLVAAIEAAGPDLDRQALLDALGALDSDDAIENSLFYALDFSEGFQGNRSVRLLRVTPEGLRPIGEATTY